MVKLFKWVASALLIIACLLIAFKIDYEFIYISYLLFATGHVIWIYLFYKQKEWSILFSNLFFFFN